ncbi:hypothetical protein MBM_08927 [Drepanopeziza brunnea f. sp. 'multigermtubi' MB_m1]|uniref:Uncharacterized protein n=1 Tax=Marssonina brunnea f. sp. multigermtubi (strain MB_m1) TaxID=1072389 RepID=K1WWB5_MARBU|nr:uncharacterized protein MBM_08927 [Drepanopeziza brunnea f. sp. 'multigermtubi' MB_m1]EKD12973.1 hypothetical protein MBM_08927 [Drepanopeziza brunnea f. sp. 'multigermtubi' MB_m1]
MADRATRPPGRESSRQGAVGYYTFRVLSPLTEPLAIQPKGLLYPGLLSLSEGPNDEMSGILFDLNELLYARLNNKITARAIVNDFLDANFKEHLLSKGVWCPLKQRGYANRMATLLSLDSKWTENLTDDEDNTPQPPPPPLRSPKGKEKEEGEEIRRLREEFAKEKRDMEQNMESQNHLSGLQTPFSKATLSFLKSLDRVATKIVLRSSSDQTTLEATGATRQKRTPLAKDSVQISVPNLSNPKRGSSTLERTDKLLRSFNKPRIDKRDTKALAILTMTDEGETKEISKEIEATDTEGVGTGPLDYQRDSETDLQGTPDSEMSFLRTLEEDGLPATISVTLYRSDHWLSTTRLHLVKKENLRTSLSECFKKLAKELKGIQSSLRPGLKDDRSLADKLYSACKNVLETTIARMNLAFTFTAAVADIRRAIAFATKTFRPAKAKADSDLDEEYECFIQDRQYFEDTSRAREKSVKYGIGSATSIRAVTLDTSLGQVEFYVVESDMLVEAYYSVGLVERYYVLVRRAFEIVIKELPKALKEDRLQMAIKAINDITGLNGLVLILFVFKTLPRLTEQDRLAAST